MIPNKHRCRIDYDRLAVQEGRRESVNQREAWDRRRVASLSPGLLAERNNLIARIQQLEDVYDRFGDGVENWDIREIEMSLIKKGEK